jgi:hypothetical protein
VDEFLTLTWCSERDLPSWTNPTGMAALGFISATMGLQVC